MISIHSLDIDGFMFTGIQIDLPGESVLIIMNEIGYIISAKFYIELSKNETNESGIVGLIKDASSIEELLYAPLVKVSRKAKDCGWYVGMIGREALLTIV